MKFFIVTLISLSSAGANALVIGDGGCTFRLTAEGGVAGQVSQLQDGQTLLRTSNLTVATYTIGSDGKLFDQNGRGCILTPKTAQLQCDVSISPTPGFSVGCDSKLSYKDMSKFIACKTRDEDWTIHTALPPWNTVCVSVTLKADSYNLPCKSPPSVSPTPSCPPTSSSSPSSARKACRADLTEGHTRPHMIIPISSSNPHTPHGITENGRVSRSDIQTIFNFDIPASSTDKICSLVFLFPRQDQLITSSFMINGDGNVGFTSLAGVVDQETTYNNTPEVARDLGVLNLSPGNSYTVATFDCPAGTTQSYAMSAPGTDFHYSQSYSHKP